MHLADKHGMYECSPRIAGRREAGMRLVKRLPVGAGKASALLGLYRAHGGMGARPHVAKRNCLLSENAHKVMRWARADKGPALAGTVGGREAHA